MIFLIIITIISISIAIYCSVSKHKIDTETDIANQNLKTEYEKLRNLYVSTSNDLQFVVKENQNSLYEKNQLEEQIKEKKKHLEYIQDNTKTTLQNQIELSQKAFENYCDVLDNKYKEVEDEYDNLIATLKESYSNQQLTLIEEYNKCQNDLAKIRATRAASIEAARREKEIKEQTNFYCLQISDEDKADIQRLENIKKTLNKPRVLSMLIWSTWFQKPLKALSANVLGTTEEVTGIYKITNIITNECYIGQAVSVRERWADHAKCGLGIDTPAGNKLYSAMKEYGLWNFSWEILEKCPKEQLNQKERFYIELYQSCDLGYNSNKGIKA